MLLSMQRAPINHQTANGELGRAITDGMATRPWMITSFIIQTDVSAALRMQEPEIGHSTGAQPTRMIRFHVRTRKCPTDRRKSRHCRGPSLAGLKARDERGLAECGRGFCPMESGRDSRVEPSLNARLRIACGRSRLQS